MAPTPRASCAGSRKPSSNRSYCQCRARKWRPRPGGALKRTTIMTETSNLHIAVVGGGPGGYAAAFLAADLGLRVTLIDPESNPGGVCLYRGCIPSKTLLPVAQVIAEERA